MTFGVEEKNQTTGVKTFMTPLVHCRENRDGRVIGEIIKILGSATVIILLLLETSEYRTANDSRVIAHRDVGMLRPS